jgi:hypothetical protein
MELYRHADQSYLFLEVLSQPNKTITKPSTMPINIPTFTLFIKIPTANPRMIAKIKAISPLRIFGFLCVAIIKVSIIRVSEVSPSGEI